MKIIVTGGTGYIGKHLIRNLLERQYHIICLSRKNPKILGVDWIYFDFYNNNDNILKNISFDAIFHLATETNLNKIDTFIEKEILYYLIDQAKQNNARFVFLSSKAASINSPSIYGKSKFILENIVKSNSAIIFRIGLVIGGDECGLYGKIVQTIRKYKVFPYLIPDVFLHIIHINDLCFALELSINNYDESDIELKNYHYLIRFNLLINFIKYNKNVIAYLKVPIPFIFLKIVRILLPDKLLNVIGVNQFLSLYNQNIKLTYPSNFNILSISKNSKTTLNRELDKFLNRLLVIECFVFTSYITKKRPTYRMLHAYVSFWKSNGDVFLNFPNILYMYPIFYFLFENIIFDEDLIQKDLNNKYLSASLISESVTNNCDLFIYKLESNKINIYFKIFILSSKIFMLSIIFLLFQWIIKYIWKRKIFIVKDILK
jgi:dTDP-4-dehydrorhamnose reductase